MCVAGCDPNQANSVSGQTALHYAALHSDLNVVGLVVDLYFLSHKLQEIQVLET